MTNFLQVQDNASARIPTNALNNTTSPITLTGLDTTKLPIFSYGYILTIWDDANYPDPGDDPNMEKVMVTAATIAVSGTITLNRPLAKAHSGTPRMALLVMSQHINEITAAINGLESTRLYSLGVTLTRTANFTAVANNRYSVDTTAGNVTATLPATNVAGQLLFIQKSTSDTNILYYSGTINGSVTSTFPVRLQLQGKLLQGDGTGNWNVIAGDLGLPSLDARYAASGSGVTSVNTRTGAVTLTSIDVGLGNVDNTSDANKPISIATQSALDLRALDSSVVHKAGGIAETITGVKQFSDNVRIVKGYASNDIINTAGDQYSGSGVRLYSTASGLTGAAGVSIFSGILDNPGTQTYFSIDLIDRTGAYLGSLFSIDPVTKVPKIEGNLNFNNFKGINLANGTASTDAINKSQLDLKANDSAVVHNTGDETITGIKTFSSGPVVPTPATGNRAANGNYVVSMIATKQDTLVSGTNIKTANGNSLLGSGDLVISGGGSAPDATTTSKGIIQLAGDLGGTAASPQVVNGQTTYYNYISNPSFELSISGGWTTYGGGTKSRVTGTSQFGTASAQQFSATAIDGGFMQTVFLPAGTFTLSLYIKMTSDVTRQNVVVRNNGVSGDTQQFRAYPGNTNFNRYSQTFTNPTAGNVEILIGLGYAGSSPGTVNFDGIQLELSSSATTYFDGSTTGDATNSYFWSGTAQESNSYRSTKTRMTSTDALPEGLVNQYATVARTISAISGATIAPLTVNVTNLNYGTIPRSATAPVSSAVTLNTGYAENILANATSGAFTITLFSTTTAGYLVTIFKTDSSANAITVTSAGTPLINGSTTYVLGTQYKYAKFMSTTTAGTWLVVGNN